MQYYPDLDAQRLDRVQRFAVCYGVAVFMLVVVLLIGTIGNVGPARLPQTPRPLDRDKTAAPTAPIAPPSAADTLHPETQITASADIPLSTVSVVPTAIPTAPPTTPLTTRPTSPPTRPTPRRLTIATTGTTQGMLRAPDGALVLAPVVADEFDGPDINSAQWQVAPWGGGGTAIARGGMATLTIAAIRTQRAFVRRTVSARIRFTAGVPLQNLAWSADLNGGTAILIGKLPTDPDHVYARVKEVGSVDRAILLPVALDDGEFHDYRIAWGNTQADFFVDGVVRASVPVAIDQPMYAWLSVASAGPFVADWLRVEEYGGANGTLVTAPLDAGERVNWEMLSVGSETPTGTTVVATTRTSDDGRAWSTPDALGQGGVIVSPPGRYLIVEIRLIGSPNGTPRLLALDATATPPPRG